MYNMIKEVKRRTIIIRLDRFLGSFYNFFFFGNSMQM